MCTARLSLNSQRSHLSFSCDDTDHRPGRSSALPPFMGGNYAAHLDQRPGGFTEGRGGERDHQEIAE